jgi:cytochrome c2
VSARSELKRWGPLIVAIPIAAILGARWAKESTPSLPGRDGPAPVPSRATAKPSPSSEPGVAKGWVGLLTEARELPSGGVKIVEVFAGSPAARAGLEPGDVIESANGTKATVASLRHVIGTTPIGQRIAIERRREGERSQLVFVLVEQSSGIGALLGRTIAAGAKGLAGLQGTEGLWPHYHEDARTGASRPGVASSALACAALATAGPGGGPEAKAALAKGLKALLARRGADGGLDDPAEEIRHRVYANAFLLLALSADPSAHASEIASVREWLARAQVGESAVFDLDYRFGGWNYYETTDLARLRTDVSVASWALDALAAAGLPQDRVEWARAGRFLERCQNYELVSRRDAERAREAPLRDGGFAFMPRLSKAGSVDVSDELVVFRSYGSATADGTRALLASSGGRRDERTAASLRWLARAYTLDSNPGFGADDAAGWSKGIHFYWLASLARALHAARVDKLGRGDDLHAWPDELARFLSDREEPAGTWRSPNGRMAEDSRTVATSFAILALAAARDRVLAADGSSLDGGSSPPPPPPDFEPPRAAARSVLERGRRLFLDRARTSCTTCHDDSGAGNGPSLVGVGDRYYETKRTHEAAAEALRHHIRDPETYPGLTGRTWSVKMFAYKPDLISDDELMDLIEFLLSRTGSAPVSGAGALDAIAPVGTSATTARPSAERGGVLAMRLKCTACHGAGKSAPSLLGVFDRLARERGGAAAAREALAAKLASHPQTSSAEDARDLIEFLRDAR